jgi:oligopeptidase B
LAEVMSYSSLLQDPKYYEYMKSYSPVDNIGANGTEYPNILVTAGLHDPRV